jgi:lysozyme
MAQGAAGSSFDPAALSSQYGLTADQLQAFTQTRGMQGAYQPLLSEAATATQSAMGPLSAGDIAQYMSPYQQYVVDATMKQLGLQQGQQLQDLNAKAISQNALGGNRADMARGYLQGQQSLASGSTLAGLYNQNYAQALAAAQGQQREALSAAQQLSGLAGLGQQMGYQDVGALAQSGAYQQAFGQQGLDLATKNAQTLMQFPYYNAQYLAGITGAVAPGYGGTSAGEVKQTQTPGLGTIVGAGLTGLGLFSRADGGRTDSRADDALSWLPAPMTGRANLQIAPLPTMGGRGGGDNTGFDAKSLRESYDLGRSAGRGLGDLGSQWQKTFAGSFANGGRPQIVGVFPTTPESPYDEASIADSLAMAPPAGTLQLRGGRDPRLTETMPYVQPMGEMRLSDLQPPLPERAIRPWADTEVSFTDEGLAAKGRPLQRIARDAGFTKRGGGDPYIGFLISLADAGDSRAAGHIQEVLNGTRSAYDAVRAMQGADALRYDDGGEVPPPFSRRPPPPFSWKPYPLNMSRRKRDIEEPLPDEEVALPDEEVALPDELEMGSPAAPAETSAPPVSRSSRDMGSPAVPAETLWDPAPVPGPSMTPQHMLDEGRFSGESIRRPSLEMGSPAAPAVGVDMPVIPSTPERIIAFEQEKIAPAIKSFAQKLRDSSGRAAEDAYATGSSEARLARESVQDLYNRYKTWQDFNTFAEFMRARPDHTKEEEVELLRFQDDLVKEIGPEPVISRLNNPLRRAVTTAKDTLSGAMRPSAAPAPAPVPSPSMTPQHMLDEGQFSGESIILQPPPVSDTARGSPKPTPAPAAAPTSDTRGSPGGLPVTLARDITAPPSDLFDYAKRYGVEGGPPSAASAPSPVPTGIEPMRGLDALRRVRASAAAPAPEPTPAPWPATVEPAEKVLSPDGIELIKRFEGFSASPYGDYKQTSIGYGSRARPGDTRIDEAEAHRRLLADTAPVAQYLRNNAKEPLSQDQFDALVSFGHNEGVGALSRVLNTFNTKGVEAAANHMLRYVYAGKPGEPLEELDALKRRRIEEVAMMLDMADELPKPTSRLPSYLAATPKQAPVTPRETRAPAKSGASEGSGLLGGLLGGLTPDLGAIGRPNLSDQDRRALIMMGLGMMGGGPFFSGSMRGGLEGLSAAYGQEAQRASLGLTQRQLDQQMALTLGQLGVERSKLGLEQQKIDQGRYVVQQSGVDMFGRPQYTMYDRKTGATVSPGGAKQTEVDVGGDLHGEEYLKKIPQEYRQSIRSIANYDMPMPTGNDLVSTTIRNLVLQYDPEFDATGYKAKQAGAADFTSGEAAKGLVAGRTAIGHLREYIDGFEKLHSTQAPLLNQFRNFASRELGSGRTSAVDTVRQHLAQEVARFYKGVGVMTDDERKAVLNELSPTQSPEQMRDSLRALFHMMQSKVDAYEGKRATAKLDPDKYPIWTPKDLENIQYIRKKLGLDAKRTPAPAPAAAPTPAPAPAEPTSVSSPRDLTRVEIAGIKIPRDNIEKLRKHPESAPSFDQVYGEGAAKRVLEALASSSAPAP